VVVVEKRLDRRRRCLAPLYPGFNYSNCSMCLRCPPGNHARSEPPRHGLQILPYEGGAVLQQDGGYLAMYRDHDANRREFARHPSAMPKPRPLFPRHPAPLPLHPPMLMHAPDPTSSAPDLNELMYIGKKFSKCRKPSAKEWSALTMSISDYLDEYFEHPVIKAYLAVLPSWHRLGPMSPGSAGVLPCRHGRCRRQYRRSALLMAAWVDHGRVKVAGRVRRRNPRRQGRDWVLVKNTAPGVVLDGGDEIMGNLLSPTWMQRTFLKPSKKRNRPPPS
jgi:hypothetical protein